MEEKNIYTVSFTGLLVALVTVSAFIRIPTPIVSITLQVLIVLLAPMIFGVKVSLIAFALYVAMGLAGLPVFTNGGGPSYVLQPSFGFLLGFIFSTIPNGLLSSGGGKVKLIIGGLAGVLTIHAFGLGYFFVNMNHIQGKSISLIQAATIVFVPFIIPDLIKLAVAVIIASKLKKHIAHGL